MNYFLSLWSQQVVVRPGNFCVAGQSIPIFNTVISSFYDKSLHESKVELLQHVSNWWDTRFKSMPQREHLHVIILAQSIFVWNSVVDQTNHRACSWRPGFGAPLQLSTILLLLISCPPTSPLEASFILPDHDIYGLTKLKVGPMVQNHPHHHCYSDSMEGCPTIWTCNECPTIIIIKSCIDSR
jgi:hypothetical protein